MDTDRGDVRDRGDYFPTLTWLLAIVLVFAGAYYIMVGIIRGIQFLVHGTFTVIGGIFNFLFSWPGLLLPIAAVALYAAYLVYTSELRQSRLKKVTQRTESSGRY